MIKKCDKCWHKIGDMLRLIAEELGISKDMGHTIVRNDLDKRTICSRFVPHTLTDEQKAKRRGNFWRLDFHVWTGSNSSGKHRHGRWDLVLSVRSGIKTAIDGVVFAVFLASRLQKSKIKTLLIAFSTTKASSRRNLFLQVKPLMLHFTRPFWTDCYSVFGRFGQSCTGLENGCSCGLRPVSPLEGGHQRCSFCGRGCHQRSCDSRSTIDSRWGICWLFPKAVRTLPNVCFSGRRLFWRAIKKICQYILFCLFSDRIHRTF